MWSKRLGKKIENKEGGPRDLKIFLERRTRPEELTKK
jgi:hypothetical protein